MSEKTEAGEASTEAPKREDACVRAGLEVLDAVGLASLSAGQFFGFLSNGAERVELLNVVGEARLRVSDRSDEGWPGIEIALPGAFEFELCNTSVLTRTIGLAAESPRSQVVAEFEALGLGPSGALKVRRTREQTRWVRELSRDTSLLVIANDRGRCLATIFQRRTHEALEAAVRRRTERNNFGE